MILILLVAVVFGFYGYKLFDLQILQGDYYRTYANQTVSRTLSLEAPRGQILDRNGIAIATNRMSRDIQLDRIHLTRGTENEIILRLQRLLTQTGDEWIHDFPILLQEDGTYAFAENAESAIAALKTQHRFQQYSTAQQIMDKLVQTYKCEDYSKEEAYAIISVRSKMDEKLFSLNNPYTFAEDVSAQTVVILEENQELLPGVTVVNSTMREYPLESVGAHVVGVSGAISAEEYKAKKADGYRITDEIGKFGIEKIAEAYLRGTRGSVSSRLDQNGAVISESVIQPIAGNSVYLTIDSRLQKVAQDALDETVQSIIAAGKAMGGGPNTGADCSGGAAIVMDCNTFEFLACVSNPDFNLSTYWTDAPKLNADTKGTPLLNRALNSTYQPGSVMKVSSSLAALESGYLTPYSHITCNRLMQYSGSTFQCLGHHGGINVSKALQVSCNIFFYNVGLNVGIDTLNKYSQQLGLGTKTGIELPESVGILAGRNDTVTQSQSNGQWYPGDTMQAAIGQSHNLFTPIQVASYISTIANGGTRREAHLIDKVVTYDQTETILEKTPATLNQLSITEENLKAIHYGMRLAMTDGSAGYALSNYPIPVAGKTGTAQTYGGSDHGLLACFAPYDDPEIVVVVVLEHGLHGYSAATTVRTILDAYFYGIGYEEEEAAPEEEIVPGTPLSSPTE